MIFALLEQRLVAEVRRRVRNGEISERSLARRLGASQPHIHNVLKGVRYLSSDLADRIVLELDIRVEHLLFPEDLDRVRAKRSGFHLSTESMPV